jgi:hypothetical protein
MRDHVGAGSHVTTGMSGDDVLGPPSVAERRARLVVQCARVLLGEHAPATGDLHLPLSVTEFEYALQQHFGSMHPELVYRTDSTLERARLERRNLRHLPKVVLRQGAPRRTRRVPARDPA